MGLVRENLPKRGMSWKMAKLAGPGESPYTLYDRQIAAEAQKWLHDASRDHHDKPWVLFVSFVSPHFPLTARPEHYYRYYDDPRLPMPKLYKKSERPAHPFLREYAESFNYDDYFETDEDVRRAIAGYYGLCSFVDEQIGKVLDAIDRYGLREATRVVYTSDHGDNLGARGLWGKSTMYEESAGVPLIVAGEGIPSGVQSSVPATLLDLYPFIIDAVGGDRSSMIDSDHPGVSIAEIANGAVPQRTILSEYHGMGSTTGAFMVRDDRYKYVHYVSYPPQLFDLKNDPEELHDLGTDPAYADVRKELEKRLRSMLDPEEVDRRAKKRQAELLALNGGREAVIARGDLGFTPPPGYRPDFG